MLSSKKYYKDFNKFNDFPPDYEVMLNNSGNYNIRYNGEMVNLSGIEIYDFPLVKQVELKKYAKYLGANLDKHPFLFKYVMESIVADLPEEWEEIKKNNEYIYYNKNTKKKTYKNPVDAKYELIIKNVTKKYKKNKKYDKKCVMM